MWRGSFRGFTFGPIGAIMGMPGFTRPIKITFPLELFIKPIRGEVGYSAVRSRKRESFSGTSP